MSLRNFHLIFILFAIAGADLFGGWTIWNYSHSHDSLILTLGMISIVGGFGLIAYVFWLVRKFESAGIH